MIPKNLLIIVIFVPLLTLVAAGSTTGAPDPLLPQHPPELKLRAGTFVPAVEGEPALPDALRIAPDSDGEAGYYIVQFGGPVQEAWKTGIQKVGGEILEYLPDYAFKVYMTAEQAAMVDGQREVVWTGIFQPAYKVDPELADEESGRSGSGLIKVRTESNADIAQVAGAVAGQGAAIVRQEGSVFIVLVDSNDQISELASIGGVAWLEPFTFHETHNEYGGGQILGANTANASGYDGSTQIVAVADTGLGGGTAATAHPDIPAGRIVEIQNWTLADSPDCYDVIPDGAKDVDLGHGTHVALSAVGDGGPSGEGRGTAPAAGLVFQAIEDYVDFIGGCSTTRDDYLLVGIPADLNVLFQPAYDAGARIHSNSWGSNRAGAYTSDSADVDEFMWNNPQMLVTTSSGNAGIDANADGVIDPGSVGSPATAKNALVVGASENERPDNYPCDTSASDTSCSGFNTIRTCGESWPSKCPVNPLKDDPSAGNERQMAAFSSRGPADDGRIKPDIVAPGTWVLSGYSMMYQQGYGDPVNPQNGFHQYDGWGYPFSETYKYMGGTSMSNPLAAGGAAVVRDYYQKSHGHSASAALVKATLINSAVDLLDENNDGVNDNDYPIPNIHEGWGRVDLAAATNDNRQFVDNSSGISGGNSEQHQFDVAGGRPLRVTLVWSDYYSSVSAAVNLVNDLNLVVSGPDGSPTYKGNVFSGGWSQTGGTADSRNNVENVYVQAPSAGTWTVQITGANVPAGPQPYALVVAQPDTQAIQLSAGWNMISSSVDPQEPGLETMLADIKNDVVIIKNIKGEIYWPEYEINYIGDWDVREGYQIYMDSPATFTIIGQAVDPAQTPIDLQAGWNMIAFLSDTPMAIEQALATISDELLLAKNGVGQVYWPSLPANNIGDMQPGQGYKLYMQDTATLVYPDG